MDGESDTSWFHRLNKSIEISPVGRWFQLAERNTTFTQEIRAGVVAFLTIAYIIAVNPAILSATGGTCTSNDCTGPLRGQFDCRFTDPGFARCVEETKRSLVAATTISSMIGCLVMGAVANLPFAMAPGMGINAYFTYEVVGYLGTGNIGYKEALAAVFIEGWIFILISVSGVRGRLIEMVPKNLMLATGVGIGLFLAFIGLQSANGIGLITFEGATLVTLGGCPLAAQTKMYVIPNATYEAVCTTNPEGQPLLDIGPASANHACHGQRMQSPSMWLGIWGGMLMVVLMNYGVKASIMYGVFFATIIAWIPGHAASYLGPTGQVPGGEARLEYFRQGAEAPDPTKTLLALDFTALKRGDTWVALVTFLYLDFLDATGTLFSMARLINDNVPGFVDDYGRFPKQMWALLTDGFSIVVGSIFGTSPLTVVAESSVGIKEGGRTGITALVLAFGFFICMFLAPIFSNIPGYATGPALILVGALLMEHAVEIEWHKPTVAVPAFVTIALMPLTYSIAYGVLGGLMVNIALWFLCAVVELGIVVFSKKMTMRQWFVKNFSSWIRAFGSLACCAPYFEDAEELRRQHEAAHLEAVSRIVSASLEPPKSFAGKASMSFPDTLEMTRRDKDGQKDLESPGS